MKTQTGFNYILLSVSLAFVIGAWVHGYYQGGVTTKLSYVKKVEKLEKKLEDLQKTAEAKLLKEKQRLDNLRRKSNATIKTLLASNAKFKKWWNNRVPEPAINYAFRVR